jgi:hypothetical protein
MKFRKKPVVIEAVRWTGENREELTRFCPRVEFEFVGCGAYVNTLEGEMKALAGDWIIRGVRGEFYPCKPDIFEATYEAVPE